MKTATTTTTGQPRRGRRGCLRHRQQWRAPLCFTHPGRTKQNIYEASSKTGLLASEMNKNVKKNGTIQASATYTTYYPFRASEIKMVALKMTVPASIGTTTTQPVFLGGRGCCPRCYVWGYTVNARGVEICVPLHTLSRRFLKCFLYVRKPAATVVYGIDRIDTAVVPLYSGHAQPR